MWGSVTPYTDGERDWSTYKYCNGSYDTLTKYCTDSSLGVVDNKTTLEPEDDATTQIMGGDWRMPTKDEFQELLENTKNEWVEDYNSSGVNGTKFTSKTDTSKYIFIPMAGYYDNSAFEYDSLCVWSSSLSTSTDTDAWHCFTNSYISKVVTFERYYAVPVRGVFE